MYALLIMSVTTLYVVKGGMYSVVITEVLQFLVMTVACIVIGVIAMNALAENPLLVPEGWMNPFFGARLELDWSGLISEVTLTAKLI